MATVATAVKKAIKIPPSYICSITGQIMVNPVFSADGHTYECEAIEEWLKTHDTSPRTNLKLRHKELVENHDKRGDISDFLQDHPELYERDEVYLPKSWANELVTAIKANKIKEVQECLKKDRRLLTEKLDRDYTAFHLAAQFGSAVLANILLEHLTKRNELDKILEQSPAGFKPLYLNALLEKSLIETDKSKFSLLLKLGAEINQLETGTQNTLLHKLAIQGNPEPVGWLLDQGLNIESQNAEGNTPLLLSVLHGHVALTKYLLQSKADIEVLNEQQKNPLYLVVERKDSKESEELIELLLNEGANPMVCCGAEKLTPLHIAAKLGNIAAVERLLKTKVLVDALSVSGDTPLHLAATAGQGEVIPLLLEAGASHKAKNTHRKTPMEVASGQAISDLIEQTARKIEQAKFGEIEILRQLVKEQGSRIEQLEKEVASLKQWVRSEKDKKYEQEEIEVSIRSPLIFSSSSSISSSSSYLPLKPDLKVSAEDVQKFLNHVAAGQQDEAEAMLKKNSELALTSGTVTDHAKRTFKNITGFQYAVWALDWHMWKMIKKYLSKEAAQEQSRGFAEGSWVAEHGEHANWKKLTEAQQTLIDNCQSWDWRKINEFWVQQVGGAQLLLPAHVLQEYCQPGRPFDPCPKFDLEGHLIRRLDYAGNQALQGLRERRAVVLRAAGDPEVRRAPAHHQWPHRVDGTMECRADRTALCALFSARSQQRATLVAELAKGRSFSPSK